MKKLQCAALCVLLLLLGWISGEGDGCDVYVANAGAGNCIYVLFSASEEGGLSLKRKGLWVDCGIGKRGFIPGGMWPTKWEKAVGDFFFGEGLLRRAKEGDTMLWITHLHEDHINRVFEIGKNGKSEGNGISVSSIITSVGWGEGAPRDIKGKDESAIVGKVLSGANTQKVKVWGSKRKYYQGKVEDAVARFWGDFPVENISIKPFIPSDRYGRNKGEHLERNLDANDTSLVLALEYYGIKVLFPGDAPGKMCGCLDPIQKSFVEDVDILIAPHHGSEEKKNSLWYSSNRRFCTIISGDPSFKGWGIPGLANYGIRSHSTRLKVPRAVYYSNAQRDEVLKSEIEFPVFCTWVGIEDKNGKVIGAEKFVGYHIKINSEGGREDAGKIKVFEILYNDKAKGNETKYPEKEIEIERPSKRRELELSGTSVLFEIPAVTGDSNTGR